MFRNFSLIHPMRNDNEFDETDLWLETDETELQNQYEQFYEDVFPEFRKFGEINKFYTCSNETAPHLRGNVYVEYVEEQSAILAFKGMRGRWYDNKQIWPRFCTIESWKGAICTAKRKCNKRYKCNFLHLF